LVAYDTNLTFIGEVVPVAQRVTGDGGESAAPDGGGGFTDYALVSLHCLRIHLDTSYRMKIDLLKEVPQITGEIASDWPISPRGPRCVRHSIGSV